MTDNEAMNAAIHGALTGTDPDPEPEPVATDFDAGPREPPLRPMSVSEQLREAHRRMRAGGRIHLRDMFR